MASFLLSHSFLNLIDYNFLQDTNFGAVSFFSPLFSFSPVNYSYFILPCQFLCFSAFLFFNSSCLLSPVNFKWNTLYFISENLFFSNFKSMYFIEVMLLAYVTFQNVYSFFRLYYWRAKNWFLLFFLRKLS